VGKSGVLEHKSGNISETRKASGKVTGGTTGTHQRSFKGYHRRPPTASSFPRFGVRNPHPKLTPIAIISGTGEATDFIFNLNIHGVYPNKSALKILEKRERGRIRGLPIFWGYPKLSQERVKLRTSNLDETFIGSGPS